MVITTEGGDTSQTYDSKDFYIGLGLAISSSIFIGASFIVKKKALIRLQRYGSLPASSGGYGYLKEWIWWAGLLSMGIGEAANFIAYGFAPASLVTPLGALSVLVSAILAAHYLKERVNLLGKIGCFLCVLGSTVIVLHSPKEEEINNLNKLVYSIKDPLFITYILFVIMCSTLIVWHLGPKYGKQNILVYIILCSAIGSLTVMSCKGLSLAIKESISENKNMFANWLTWVFLFSVILCVIVQMNYLNKSLDSFDTTIVTPIYYVFFTTLVIVASTILFKEWENMSIEDILGCTCGFLVIIIAIFLLNVFREVDIQYGNIRHMLRPKRDILSCHNARWNNRDNQRLVSRFDLERDHTYGTPDVSRTI